MAAKNSVKSSGLEVEGLLTSVNIFGQGHVGAGVEHVSVVLVAEGANGLLNRRVGSVVAADGVSD